MSFEPKRMAEAAPTRAPRKLRQAHGEAEAASGIVPTPAKTRKPPTLEAKFRNMVWAVALRTP